MRREGWCSCGGNGSGWSRTPSGSKRKARIDFAGVRVLVSVAMLFTAPTCSLRPLPDRLITTPTELAACMEGQAVDSFFGEARVEYYGEGKARKGKLLVMSRPPAELRMEVLSFTDDLISVVVVNEAGFKYFERGNKKCFTGPLCAAPVISRFPLISSPEKLVPLLQGKAPLLPEPHERRLDFNREEGVYVLEAVRGVMRQIVKVRDDCRSVAGMQIWEGDEMIAEFTFDGAIDAGGSQIPRRIRLRAPGAKADLSIEYREAKLGYRLEGDPFVFECPKGTEVEELDCKVEL